MLLVGGRQQTESYWPAAAAAAAKASAPPSLQHNHADVSSICISIVGHHLKRARKRFSCKTHDLPNYELHSNPLFKKAPSSPFVFGLTCCIEERPTDRRPTDHPTSQDLKLASNATSVLRPRLYWPHAHIVTLNVSPVGLHDDSIPPVSLFGLSTGSANRHHRPSPTLPLPCVCRRCRVGVECCWLRPFFKCHEPRLRTVTASFLSFFPGFLLGQLSSSSKATASNPITQTMCRASAQASRPSKTLQPARVMVMMIMMMTATPIGISQ